MAGSAVPGSAGTGPALARAVLEAARARREARGGGLRGRPAGSRSAELDAGDGDGADRPRWLGGTGGPGWLGVAGASGSGHADRTGTTAGTGRAAAGGADPAVEADADPAAGEAGQAARGAPGGTAPGGTAPGGTRSARPVGGQRRRGYSGAGPDPRDPQTFGNILGRLVKARGWQRPAAEARVFGAWEAVAGADVAAHCRPMKLEAGELTIEAESTAWATQLRLLSGKLLARIGREVGHNVVLRLNIHGPVAPSWAKGPRRVRGRGPRDTYG